ncbi:FecR domain-containing protein [Humisphaera borealis]|uniref:FecR domain-containing protein n=1 Tax=Humisphaera borealis TaxID=2807512 RepID=A0A7M2WZL0_9BACT|nr:FecR domain-containing protein [Humisphaera borealis]QOV90938.1 FecR domain-containing protein [Humisphaera borealis]
MTRRDISSDDELLELIAALQQDLLTDNDAERLSAKLKASDRAVDIYIRLMYTHADLRWRMGGVERLGLRDEVAGEAVERDERDARVEPSKDVFQQTIFGLPALSGDDNRDEAPSISPPISSLPRERANWWNTRRRLLAGVAALIVVGTATIAILLGARPAVVATLESATNATWNAGSARFYPGERLREGAVLDLAKGSISLKFLNGVEVSLKGPSRIDVTSAEAVEMRSGWLRAHVPAQAVGFTVRTEFVEIVDLGTEFSVVATPDTAVEVKVLDGTVEARPTPQAGGGAAVSLVTGQMATVDAAGVDVEVAAPATARTPPSPGIKPVAVTGGPSHPNQTSEPSNLLGESPESFWAGHPGHTSWELVFDFGQRTVVPYIRVEYFATRYIPKQASISTSVDGTKWDALGELAATEMATLSLNRELRFVKIEMTGKTTRRHPAVRSVTFPSKL